MIDGVERGWHLPAPPGEAPSSWVLFQGKGYRGGAIRFPAHHPRWGRINDIPGLPVLLFPRQPVRIAPASGGWGTIDAGSALFLDSEERYERACLAEAGDRTDWFALDEELLLRLAPAVSAPRKKARRAVRIAVSPAANALQRRAFRHALVSSEPDELLLEEALCAVLEGLRTAAARRVESIGRGSSHLVAALRDLLATRYRENLRLGDLGRELGVSGSHLCRVFRQETSGTIHDHRERLRFAAALDAFEDASSDLTMLALDLGYSSHAHFATNFRRAFGVAPYVLRSRR